MKKRESHLAERLVLGMLIVVAVAAIIWSIEFMTGTTLLAGEDEKIANYLALIGVSFSVTFITTSLFGGLSDKSEKIYWLSYPESYLINTPLNFMVLSTLSFVCLGIQAVATALIVLPEAVRESIFFSSFIVGIVAIIVLSYKFTAVFFRRKKLVEKVEIQFIKLIEDEERKPELREAIVGLFNNTLEAATIESGDFGRVSENINLLLKYSENEICNFWLRKLIVEIGRNNTSMLSQLVLELENTPYYDVFTRMLEFAALSKNVPFDGSEVMNTIYDVRLGDIKKKLGDEPLFDELGQTSGEKWEQWTAVARELKVIFTKIDITRPDNCLFVLDNMIDLPYELLQHTHCSGKVLEMWDGIVALMCKCAAESDTISYQQLQEKIFEFLYSHPSYYYDDYNFGCRMREQLSDEMHRRTATAIGSMDFEYISYMIDVIENEKNRNAFLLWMTDRMAEGSMPLEIWGLNKKAEYEVNGKYEYSKDMSNCVVAELIAKRAAVKASYRERSEKKVNLYDENLAVRDFELFMERYTRLLYKVREFDTKYHCSLENFLKAAVNDVYVGEDNSFMHMPYDFFGDEEEEEGSYVNRYVLAFDILVKETGGLAELLKAVELTDGNGYRVNNYYVAGSAEAAQKKTEMLFLLKHILGAVNMKMVRDEDIAVCAEIMASILTNPCVGPVKREASENPAEVNDCLEFIRNNNAAKATVKKFISDMDDEFSVLNMLYEGATSREAFGETEYANELHSIAEAFDGNLKALDENVS